jgi:hypothetical protein
VRRKDSAAIEDADAQAWRKGGKAMVGRRRHAKCGEILYRKVMLFL